MKIETQWCGICLLAETQEEKEILAELRNVLPQEVENQYCYEEGRIALDFGKKHDSVDSCGFDLIRENPESIILLFVR